MSRRVTNGVKKRKHISEDDSSLSRKADIPDDVGLEMQSEDEGDKEESASEDDGEAEAFPDLDVGSDSESEDEGDEDDGEGESEEDVSDDDDLHIFPRSKTIKSNITGQPKKVYPEIEPDYASDSSTEEVRR